MRLGLGLGLDRFRKRGGGFDPDASAFITAAGITDATQQSAINTLVVGLKAQGLWNKMKAVYPFVGGTATSHKFNLKDPRDLDAAFRLVFNGGWTHSATGAKPNGSNAYADTFLANNVMAQNSLAFSIYLGADNTGGAATSCAIGAFSSGWGSSIYPGTNAEAGLAILNGDARSLVNSDSKSRGFYSIGKTASDAYYNTRGNVTTTTFTTSAPKTTSFKLSRAGDFNGDYSAQEHRFCTIGDGLSSTESVTLYNLIQTFQTSLSRQVS